jgi:hypothetical protein
MMHHEGHEGDVALARCSWVASGTGGSVLKPVHPLAEAGCEIAAVSTGRSNHCPERSTCWQPTAQPGPLAFIAATCAVAAIYAAAARLTECWPAIHSLHECLHAAGVCRKKSKATARLQVWCIGLWCCVLSCT